MRHLTRFSALRLSCTMLALLLVRAAIADDSATVPIAAQEEAAVRAAVARVSDSVVQIRTIGGLEEVERMLMPDGPTTGLVISPDGWIVSSAFNFVQQPASILVTFASGEQAPATLVAKDHSRMLALLKVQGGENLAVAGFVPSADIRPGQTAIAVGRTFRADRPNVSVGIVSAVNRMLGKVIQTDADVSAANYGGPLIDNRGRVFGVIVPMAPQSTSELAGAEWYDSGIGFAVPLAEIHDAIERMKTGKDQHAGTLGISLAGRHPHETPAEIAAVLPGSPADQAELHKGDRIVAMNGRPIGTQSDLSFALGPHYAGDELSLKISRGDKQLERTLTLAGELPTFRHAFLGILPMRTMAENAKPAKDAKPDSADKPAAKEEEEKPAGIVVRMVYPNSPAATANIQPGDRVIRIQETDITNVDQAIDAMNAVWPEAEVAVRVLRDEKPLDLSLKSTRLPTNIPNELPPAFAANNAADTAKAAEAAANPAADERDLKLAEFPESCRVYAPPSHAAGRPVGMLLWLGPPNETVPKELIHDWQSICDRDGLLLVVPTAADPTHWEKTELEYLSRLTERVLHQYKVDPRRVVVYGQGTGGAIAYLLALGDRDVFRGVATSATSLPRTVTVPPNEPSNRLAVFAAQPQDNRRVAQARVGLKKLADAGYPVTSTTLSDASGRLTPGDREQLARWIDTLDRF